MPQLSTFNLPLSTPPGARLYHSTASVWLSVDPLSDKYPSVSPYVYCANNPVRLVDPDGRDIEYNSFADKIIVTFCRLFDGAFRKQFNELNKSEETYVFAKGNHIVGNVQSERPFLSTDGKKIFINYDISQKDKLGGETLFSMLKHETGHAMQFEYGEIGFMNSGGRWSPLFYDLSDEYNANEEMYRGTNWRTGENYNMWNNSSVEQRIEGLHNAYGFLYYNEENPQLFPINVPFKERRQDDVLYALPNRPRQ